MPPVVRSASSAGPVELPPWVRTRAIPVAAALLTLLFVVTGFPYDRLAPAVAARVSQVLGAQVSIASLGPSLSLLGPGVRASGLSVLWPDGSQLRLDSLRVRPAWSFAWLRGRPAFALRLAAPLGQVNGTLIVGSAPGFDGTVRDLELAKLPLQNLVPGASLDGKASGDLDLTNTPGGCPRILPRRSSRRLDRASEPADRPALHDTACGGPAHGCGARGDLLSRRSKAPCSPCRQAAASAAPPCCPRRPSISR